MKVSSVFLFVAQEPRYGYFIFKSSRNGVCIIVKGRQCQYLGPWAVNKKNMGNLLYQTLKVEDKKLLSCFICGTGAEI